MAIDVFKVTQGISRIELLCKSAGPSFLFTSGIKKNSPEIKWKHFTANLPK
jgi:hypothetical protein